MKSMHAQEEVLKEFDYRGLEVALVRWSETLWCGKIGYARNCTDEPDVESIAAQAAAVFPVNTPNEREKDWEACLSFNYPSQKRPNGVMFGFCVGSEAQPDCYDVVRVPSALYMRIQICDAAFKALKVEPWTGGIPPYEWIGERIAPDLGYQYGDDVLPVIEYYQHNPESHQVEACYLYVPVQSAQCFRG